jgi:hypothetical protein
MIERKPWVGILERLCIHTLLHPYLLSSPVFFCVCRSCGEEEWYEVGCWQVLVGRRRALVRDGRVRCFGHGYMTYIKHTHTHTHTHQVWYECNDETSIHQITALRGWWLETLGLFRYRDFGSVGLLACPPACLMPCHVTYDHVGLTIHSLATKVARWAVR